MGCKHPRNPIHPVSPSSSQAVTRRAATVASGTLTSRVLGAARDVALAASFPVALTDAFFVAFTIPNTFRAIVAEGTVSAALIPVYTEVKHQQGAAQARAFFRGLMAVMVVVLLALSIAGSMGAPWIVQLYAPGYTADRFETTVELTRVLFPYLFLMGFAAIFTGGLHAHHRFAPPAFAPAFLNLCLIGAALFSALTTMDPKQGIQVLAWAALLGGTLHVLVQAPALRTTGLLAWPRWSVWKQLYNGKTDTHVRRALKLMVPLIAGGAVYQINILLARLLASYLPEGAQSYLYYSQRLVEIPQGMFALAIATASLPALSALRAKNDRHGLRQAFRKNLKLTAFLAVPSSAALWILSQPIVATLFGHGAFHEAHVHETTLTLRWMALGILAVATCRTTVPIFYAHQDTRSPVVGAIVNLIIFGLVAWGTLFSIGTQGLAMAITAGAIAQLITLLMLTKRHIPGAINLSVPKAVLRHAVATTPAAILAYVAKDWIPWIPSTPLWMRVSVLFAMVLGWVMLYIGTAQMIRVEESKELLGAFNRRLKRN